LINLLLVL